MGKPLNFTDSDKKIILKGDILDMITNSKSDAVSLEHPRGLMLDFLDEMEFDVKHTGNKSSVKLINTPVIRASGVSLSSNPNEICDK